MAKTAGRMRRWIGAALLLGGVCACSEPEHVPLGTDTTYYGYIDRGRRFEVSIGDGREAARAAMVAQGFQQPEAADCADSGMLRKTLRCAPGERFDIYHRHRGLGHDAVSLRIDGDRVAAINWSSILFQIDS
ncbi:MAG: hypothetical protein QM608_21850 [Caulobacter sp.]